MKAGSAGMAIAAVPAGSAALAEMPGSAPPSSPVRFEVNGKQHELRVDNRTTGNAVPAQ